MSLFPFPSPSHFFFFSLWTTECNSTFANRRTTSAKLFFVCLCVCVLIFLNYFILFLKREKILPKEGYIASNCSQALKQSVSAPFPWSYMLCQYLPLLKAKLYILAVFLDYVFPVTGLAQIRSNL